MLKRRNYFLALLAIVAGTLSACSDYRGPTSSLEVARKGLHAAALSNKGEYALIGSIYDGGSLWRIASQERLYNWNHDQEELLTLIAADFSADGNFALSADPHRMVLWEVSSGKSSRFWTAPAKILDVELGPKARTALLGLDDHSAVLFDIQRGGLLRTLKHQNRVRSVDLSADGKLALTGSEDYSARLWDLKSGQVLKQLKHADDVQLVKLSDDGSLALSVSKYDKALLWETGTDEVRGEINIGSQRIKRGVRFVSAEFNADNTLLLTGRPDQIVELWDTQTLERVDQWRLPKRDRWKPTGAAVSAVSFTEDPNQFVAVASNGFIHLLSRQTQ